MTTTRQAARFSGNRVLKTESRARRTVPSVILDAAEELQALIYVAFKDAGTDMECEAIPPDGMPRMVPGGFVRRTDAEITKIRCIVTAAFEIDGADPDYLKDFQAAMKTCRAEFGDVSVEVGKYIEGEDNGFDDDDSGE